MKLIQIVNSYTILSNLAQQKGLNIKTTWWMAKNIQRLEPEFKTFDDLRQKLVREHYDEPSTIKEGHQEEADRSFKELCDMEVEVQPYLIKLDNLNCLLGVPEMMVIEWLIVDE
jgi:hypothetical protein